MPPVWRRPGPNVAGWTLVVLSCLVLLGRKEVGAAQSRVILPLGDLLLPRDGDADLRAPTFRLRSLPAAAAAAALQQRLQGGHSRSHSVASSPSVHEPWSCHRGVSCSPFECLQPPCSFVVILSDISELTLSVFERCASELGLCVSHYLPTESFVASCSDRDSCDGVSAGLMHMPNTAATAEPCWRMVVEYPLWMRFGEDAARLFLQQDKAAILQPEIETADPSSIAFVDVVSRNQTATVLSQFSGGIVKMRLMMPDGLLPFSLGQKLNMSGTVVGIVDTGLDADHCAFRDPQLPVSSTFGNYSTRHRKIAYYGKTIAAVYGDANGHGTAVAGIAMGSILEANCAPASAPSFSAEDGVARETRVAMFGLGDASGDLPLSLGDASAAFDALRRVGGARVISNSWTTSGPVDVGVYTSFCLEVDAWAFNNPDTLIIFAAGNGGNAGANTVGCPALAKNVLAVGASHNAYQVIELPRPASVNGIAFGLFSGSETMAGGSIGPPLFLGGDASIWTLDSCSLVSAASLQTVQMHAPVVLMVSSLLDGSAVCEDDARAAQLPRSSFSALPTVR